MEDGNTSFITSCIVFSSSEVFNYYLKLFQRWGSLICWGKQDSCGGDTEAVERSWMGGKSTLEVLARWILRWFPIWSCGFWWNDHLESLGMDFPQGDSMGLSYQPILCLCFLDGNTPPKVTHNQYASSLPRTCTERERETKKGNRTELEIDRWISTYFIVLLLIGSDQICVIKVIVMYKAALHNSSQYIGAVQLFDLLSSGW